MSGGSDEALRMGTDARPHPKASDERRRLCELLERERERLLRRLARTEREAEEFRQRVGERDPCAYLSPANAREDADQAASLQLGGGAAAELREVEAALQRLQDEPERFGWCDLCGGEIPLARLELIPWTGVCERCAAKADPS